MEEQVEQDVVVLADEDEVIVPVEADEEEDVDYGAPRGAVAFVIFMILFYIAYYGIHYIEIFIIRGA